MGLELVLNRFTKEEAFEASGKKQAEFVIKGNEALVEGRIMESVEGDAIADVEAFRFIFALWENV